MLEGVVRQVRVLEEIIKARLEVDVAGMVAGIRARLEARLPLTPIPLASDLADHAGPLGWCQVRTFAWQAPQFRKIVLSHTLLPFMLEGVLPPIFHHPLPPLVEGFWLVAHPLEELCAPELACNLMALPTRVSVDADVYGAPELVAPFRGIFSHLTESFRHLGNEPAPIWSAKLASSVGLHAKLSPRVVEDGFAALSAAVAGYLDQVESSKIGASGAHSRSTFFELFHAHGPRRGSLALLMGQEWSERYSRLVFE